MPRQSAFLVAALATLTVLAAVPLPEAASFGDIGPTEAVACEWTTPASPFDPFRAAALERDRMYAADRPGFLRGTLPLGASDAAPGQSSGGGFFLLFNPGNAAAFRTWLLEEFTLDGRRFTERAGLADAACGAGVLVGALDFRNARSAQVAVRHERWAGPAEDLARLQNLWPGLADAARDRGLTGVALLFEAAAGRADLWYYADRGVFLGPRAGPDALTLATLRSMEPLGAPLAGPGWAPVTDRTLPVLSVWDPFVPGDRGVPSSWPNSPAFAQPGPGDGVCQPSRGETAGNSLGDCRPSCGDGAWQPGEGTRDCPGDTRLWLRVPARHATVQEALDAAPGDAGPDLPRVEVGPGAYPATLRLAGKQVGLLGRAGPGPDGRPQLAVLEAADARLPLLALEGGAGGEVRGLELRGGSAAISAPRAGGGAGALAVEDVLVVGPGMGIEGDFAALSVKGTSIQDVKAGGIHLDLCLDCDIQDTDIGAAVDALGGAVGLHLGSPSVFSVQNSSFFDFDGGGIHIHGPPPGDPSAPATGTLKQVQVKDSVVVGIGLFRAGTVVIQESLIEGVHATPPPHKHWGDGIVVELGEDLVLLQTTIKAVNRTGISAWGARVVANTVTFDCCGIDLQGEAWEDEPFEYDNPLNLACGCGGATWGCQVVTQNIGPPGPMPS